MSYDIPDEDISSDEYSAEEEEFIEYKKQQKEEEDDSPKIDLVVDYKGDLNNPEELKFLIKWRNKSHLHNTWETLKDMKNIKGSKKVDNFYSFAIREHEEVSHLEAEELEQYLVNKEMARELYAQHCDVERVLSSRVVEILDEDSNDASIVTQYFCKWTGLSYEECTWEYSTDISEKFQDLIDKYLERKSCITLPHRSQSYPRGSRPTFRKSINQPSYLVGGTLREYQLEGLNWLSFSWSKYNNAILADEMGLGKTIQGISFLSLLFHQHNIFGPFLIVVPLSTISAWIKESERWFSDANSIVYIGSGKSREIIREHEFYLDDGKNLKFNILITTYELVLKDKEILGGIKWAALLVDEAHRLKNFESQLHDSLKDFNTGYRLLITGTPLQNSVKELWSLLHFLNAKKFDSLENFEEAYANIKEEDQIKRLHEELKPYLLRRMKKDVEANLPSKMERILRVELSPLQKQLYKWILTKNFKELNKGNSKPSSLLNVLCELKKASNHAYLFPNYRNETVPSSTNQPLRDIIMNSGKMILLDKLLVRLKETGHRVLIFSQMVTMLDILQDYLEMKKYLFQRLDGSTPAEERKRAINHFNAPNSPDFAFILSTKAGGLGINLETADTVVIFDSDWNPQNDLQAMARAHRIGQKNAVNIYRLISKSTVEEEIIERAKQKMVLDHLIIQRMDTSGRTILSKNSASSQNFSRDELNAILQFGAQSLFKDSENKIEDEKEFDLDEILSRAESHETKNVSAEEDFLGQFNVADFGGQIKWDEIIPEEERKRAEMEELLKMEEELYFSARRRKAAAVTYNEKVINKAAEVKADVPKKKVPKKKALSASAGLTEKDIKGLIKASMKFGDIHDRPDVIKEEAELDGHKLSFVKEQFQLLMAQCQSAVSKPSEEDSKRKNITCDFGGLSNINATALVQRVKELKTLHMKLNGVSNPYQFRLTQSLKPVSKWSCTWTPKDDSMLLVGIYKYGWGNWDAIQGDSALGFEGKFSLSASEEKFIPKKDHLSRRAEYILKVLAEDTLIVEKKKKPKNEKNEKISKEVENEEKKSEIEKKPRAAPIEKKKFDPSLYKEVFRPILSQLEELDRARENPESVVMMIQKYMKTIGDHIECHLKTIPEKEQKSIEKDLWKVVAMYWPNDEIKPQQLKNLYSKIVLKESKQE